MLEQIKFSVGHPWSPECIDYLLKFGAPVLDLNAFDVSCIPRNLISEQLICHYQILPLLKYQQRLYVAVTDPRQQSVLDEIKFYTGFSIYGITVEASKLSALINVMFDSSLKEQDLKQLRQMAEQSLVSLDNLNETDKEDAPVVTFVRHVLLDAIKKGASDIHFEPYEKTYRIRYRQDGILYTISEPPMNVGAQIASRIKIMSQLDISEKRVPQDGRCKLRLSDYKKEIDFRVSSCPTVHGEKIVMRILNACVATMDIDALGYEDFQKTIFLEALQKPQGLILVTGPTGSGKTMSLYTALQILNREDINISTVEDPVEIYLEGINQVNINLKTGLTFSTVLKAFLRQDPDVIMVGEMRDFETAEIGIKAAQTGHLVLSTLHTNSAAETITRLMNIGIVPYNLTTSISLIIAQRLLRQLCHVCKRRENLPEEVLLQAGFKKSEVVKLQLYAPVGCDACHDGYRGRIGIYELLPMTEMIGDAIVRGASALEINQRALQNGMQNLRESALNKVRTGISSLAEANRVTSP